MHSGGLPAQLLSRYGAERAAPVQIDRDQIKRQGARVHDAALLQDMIGAAVRHDADRLAHAPHEVAVVARRGR